MSKSISFLVLASTTFLGAGCGSAIAVEATTPFAEPNVVYAQQPRQRADLVRTASADRPNLGGGFIEFLFSDGSPQRPRYQQQQSYEPQQSYDQRPAYDPRPIYAPQRQMIQPGEPQQVYQQDEPLEPAHPSFDPKYEKQMVGYNGKESPGTIVIDTPNKFLFLVQGNGKALRYGIGVGRPGFTWSGVKQISAKKEWPSWTPPKEMLARRPDLPRYMEGGPQNPLGARAMYLGSTLYRIHGSNEPWTIGTSVSSGCIRMRNEDVIDLYGRVNVGTRVIVI